jgi:hypothetical protein
MRSRTNVCGATLSPSDIVIDRVVLANEMLLKMPWHLNGLVQAPSSIDTELPMLVDETPTVAQSLRYTAPFIHNTNV